MIDSWLIVAYGILVDPFKGLAASSPRMVLARTLFRPSMKKRSVYSSLEAREWQERIILSSRGTLKLKEMTRPHGLSSRNAHFIAQASQIIKLQAVPLLKKNPWTTHDRHGRCGRHDNGGDPSPFASMVHVSQRHCNG